MIHVRRHKRVTASGKTTTVRAHERDGDDGVREVPAWSQPAYIGDFQSDDDQRTATCPECGGTFPVQISGNLAGHRIGYEYCPGSGLTEEQIGRRAELQAPPGESWWDDSVNEVPDCDVCGHPLLNGQCPNDMCGLTMSEQVDEYARRMSDG